MQIEITYHRIPLTLVGYYSPAEKQTRDCPGCSASFDIEAILVGGVNIDGIVDLDEIDYMAALACDQIALDKRESDEDAAVEAWRAEHEEM